jgi:hypothetical protein
MLSKALLLSFHVKKDILVLLVGTSYNNLDMDRGTRTL